MCKAIQSRVTSSGATDKSWMCVCFFIYIFFILLLLFFYFILLNFYLFIYLFNYVFILHFLSFACFCFVAVDFFIFYWPICVCVCVCVLLSLSSFPPSLFILCAGFISLLVGLGLIFRWSETKISYFGVIYNFLRVGMELAVIKELFMILYI